MEELLQSDRGAHARKVGRTFTAIRDRLRKAPWSDGMATEFCGAMDQMRRAWANETFPGVLLLAVHCLRKGRPATVAEYLGEADIDETLGSVIDQLYTVAEAEDRKAKEARRRALRARLDDGAAGFSRIGRLLAEPRDPPIATLRTGQGVYTGRHDCRGMGPSVQPEGSCAPA